MNFLKKLLPSANDRAIKRLMPLVERVNALEPSVQKLSDSELRAKTDEFRARLKEGESLDELQFEAFAVAREAAWRVLGMRPYDVQVLGGFALHQGNIAEMKTGEGKTLVATMPTYLNALTGAGVHVVTVNDYLARRDAEWMGQLYRWLGLTTGVIVNGIDDQERKDAYNADITYGQNNEFGFDYLRDNMKYRIEDYVQRELNFAIIDEVDSILIDEARTPLIISGAAEDAGELYNVIDQLIPKLKRDIDYNVDEKHHAATLTDAGIDKLEGMLKVDNLYSAANIILLHHVHNALRAHTLYKRDVNYLVHDGQVMIIDEHTGRLMEGRRWSDGLHQAVEAKEGVEIKPENHTLATVSFQNYFRLYNKLSGMTGTAKTEEEEFQKIYTLDVIQIPTNKPIQRYDQPDLIYRTEQGKFLACVEQIKYCYQKGQPVLVGTTSVEKSEIIHRLLTREGIKHEVLNAKHHAREASIVAQAGRHKRVTVATNMAGRGTDIILGGNAEYWGQALLESQGVAVRYTDHWEHVEDFVKQICLGKEDEARALREQHDVLANVSDETISDIAKTRDEFKREQGLVLEAGGLFVLGTERHESRRIDNQLRGRSGRQGDPGESRFFLSLEDDLMRIFAKDTFVNMMDRLGMDDSQPIESGMVSRSVETAQRRIEGQHFDNRKHLLEYDDVMNQQRQSLYRFRRSVLGAEGEEMKELCLDALEDLVRNQIDASCPETQSADMWDLQRIVQAVYETYDLEIDISDLNRNRDHYMRRVYHKAQEQLLSKHAELEQIEEGAFAQIARELFLKIIDQRWKEHLQTMDQLRSGIGLRGYGQRDPKKEYQREGFNLFVLLMIGIKHHTIMNLCHVQVRSAEELAEERRAYEEMIEAYQRQQEALDAQGEAQRRMEEEQARQRRLAEERRQRKGPAKAASPARAPASRGPSPDMILAPLPQMPTIDPEDELMLDAEHDAADDAAPVKAEPVRKERSLGRNAPCWCGSGKKYKKCHFKQDQG